MLSFLLLCYPVSSGRIICSCWCYFKILLLVLKPYKYHHLRWENRGKVCTKQTLTDYFVPASCDWRAFLGGSCPGTHIFQFCLIGPSWNCSGLGFVCPMRVWCGLTFWCHLLQALWTFHICFCTSKVVPWGANLILLHLCLAFMGDSGEVNVVWGKIASVSVIIKVCIM